MRFLITGISGFTGPHLAAHLLKQPAVEQVGGLDRCGSSPSTAVPLPLDIAHYQVDVCVPDDVRKAVAEFAPSHVVHLAALPQSPGIDEESLYRVNVLGTLHLLRAVREHDPETKVLIVGSSACYGRMSEGSISLTEHMPFQPVTHYAASKVAQEMVGVAFHAGNGLAVIRARSFNLVGPGQPVSLFASSIARQIAAAELGLGEPTLLVGNLDSARDFLDIRDAVRAYEQLMLLGSGGEVYNVCSGRPTPVADCLELLVAMSEVPMNVKSRTEDLMRRGQEIGIQVGDNSRLREATDWSPDIPLERSMHDLLQYWRIRLADGSTDS